MKLEFNDIMKTTKDLSIILTTLGTVLSLIFIFYKDIRPFIIGTKQKTKLSQLQNRLDKLTKIYISMTKIKNNWHKDKSTNKMNTKLQIMDFLSQMDTEVLNIELNNARIKISNSIGRGNTDTLKKEFSKMTSLYVNRIKDISIIFEKKQKKYTGFFGKII